MKSLEREGDCIRSEISLFKSKVRLRLGLSYTYAQSRLIYFGILLVCQENVDQSSHPPPPLFFLWFRERDGKIAPSELGILMRSQGGSSTQAQLKSIVFFRYLDLMSKRLRPKPFDCQLGNAFKVVGWRLLDKQKGLRLQCLWKLRDFKCGVDLIDRIHKVVEVTGHFLNLHLEQPNQRRAELPMPWSEI